MTRNLFWVDWDDPPHPQIRPASESPYSDNLKPLSTCQREITKHARELRDHWLGEIKKARATTQSEIYRGRYGQGDHDG